MNASKTKVCTRCNERQAAHGELCSFCQMGEANQLRQDEQTDYLGARLRQAAIRSAWPPAERYRRRASAFRNGRVELQTMAMVTDILRSEGQS